MSQTYNLRMPFGERNETHFSVQKLEHLGQNNSFSLPEDFLVEMTRFIKRNKIKCTPHPDQVCLPCLKAHAQWLLEKDNFDEERIRLFLSLFNCKTGHNGYYQDKHLVRKS